MKIIFLLAGNSKYKDTNKFLLPIKNKTLFEFTYDIYKNSEDANIFIFKKDDDEKEIFSKVLDIISNGSIKISLENKTQGAMITALLAVDHLVEEEELLIVNGDQYNIYDLEDVLNYFRSNQADSGVVTFKSLNPRWSYVKSVNGNVSYFKEKLTISNDAIAGVYYFKETKLFLEASYEMLKYEIKDNNQYYISPVLNRLILKNKKIMTYMIPEKNHFPLMNESDIDMFIRELVNYD